MAQTRLPQRPQQGQVFIDALRVKWIYNANKNCWERVGTVPDIPVATEEAPGLLSARLKALIDGIPEKGGHFGIIIKPLLSTVPHSRRPIHKDSIRLSYSTVAGSTIVSEKALEFDRLKVDEFKNKLLTFTSGRLKDEVFLITGNDESEFFLSDDAGDSVSGDQFEIFEVETFNPSGILTGDIELVSNSLDITCIDVNGDPIDAIDGKQCLQCDTGDENVPGFDLKLKERFVETFCVEIPGCEGPRGDRGETGDAGADGTGDGPQGEQGPAGADAPATPDTFNGIKIQDVDDIFDTAVVEIELDAANNLLQLNKAKIQVPSDDSIVDQLITSPIVRTVEFTGEDFEYSILAPNNDPVGTDDVKIGQYPANGFSNLDGLSSTQETQVITTQLSSLIDQAIEIYNKKLDEISDQWDLEIREEVEAKDAEARRILAEIAQKVNDCEWSQPLQFCLGIAPEQCNTSENLGTFAFPLAEVLGGPQFAGGTATDLGLIKVNPEEEVPVLFDANIPSTSLPNCSAYLIYYVDGAFRSENGYSVGNTTGDGTGIQIGVTNPNGGTQNVNFPIPNSVFNQSSKESVIEAYKSAPIQERAVFVQFPASCDLTPGELLVRSVIPEDSTVTGCVNFRAFQVNRPTFEGSPANALVYALSGSNDVTLIPLVTPMECESFTVQVVAANGSAINGAQLTTAMGDVINATVNNTNIGSGNDAGALLDFGVLPVGSQGDASITVDAQQGGMTELNFPVTIGTKVQISIA